MELEDDEMRKKFWSMIEYKFQLFMPEYVKNILKFSQFANIHALRGIIAQDDTLFPFDDMEIFVRSQDYLDSINDVDGQLVDDDRKKYFGVYHTNPGRFIFLPGIKRLINVLVSKLKSQDVRVLYNWLQRGAVEIPPLTINPEVDGQILRELVRELSFPNVLEIDVAQIRSAVSEDGESKIWCPKCTTVIRIRKYFRSQQWGYVITNFRRHVFMQHLTAEQRRQEAE